MSTTLIETASAAVSSSGNYLDDHKRFLHERGEEPREIAELRRAGIARFAVKGFPTTREEDWRFTNVAPIARACFVRATGDGHAALAFASAEDGFTEASVRLVFVDGLFAVRFSNVHELPPGTFVGSLRQALSDHRRQALVLKHLAHYSTPGRHAFSALNAAFFADGALVHIPRGVVVVQPIHLIFLSTGSGTVCYPRNLIVLDENAQATVVETYKGLGGGESLTCAVTEIVAHANANLQHVKVQREEREAFHVASFELRQERSSRVASHSISLGGGIVRNDIHAVLAGEGADCTLNGLYLVEGSQVVDNHMKVEHVAAHCDSHELYKGVLDGKARAVFNGLIHVHPGAQKTDAKQSNRNLLLSSEAIANSNPQLEIYADDVKCTHGSTVGQLDEDAIFYLRSRGIGVEAAQSLLTYAFASELVERIPVEPVRRALEEFLFARLPGGEVVRQAV